MRVQNEGYGRSAGIGGTAVDIFLDLEILLSSYFYGKLAGKNAVSRAP